MIKHWAVSVGIERKGDDLGGRMTLFDAFSLVLGAKASKHITFPKPLLLELASFLALLWLGDLHAPDTKYDHSDGNCCTGAQYSQSNHRFLPHR